MDARWLWHKDFDPPKILQTPETLAQSVEWNKHIIRELHARGYKFVDIGPKGPVATNPFYKAELEVLKELGVTPIPWPNPTVSPTMPK